MIYTCVRMLDFPVSSIFSIDSNDSDFLMISRLYYTLVYILFLFINLYVFIKVTRTTFLGIMWQPNSVTFLHYSLAIYFHL